MSDYEEMKVSELRKLAESVGMTVTGMKKAEIIAALEAFEDFLDSEDDEEEEALPPASVRVERIRNA